MNFWLPVRKEYILDNLDSLIDYLSRYDFKPGVTNDSFDSTFACLEEFASEIGATLRNTPVLDTIDFGFDTDTAARILGATILTGLKTGRNEWQPLADLCLLLARTNAWLPNEVLERLYNIILNCIRRLPILQVDLTWADLQASVINVQVFIAKLKMVRMQTPSQSQPWHCFESQGLIIVPPDSGLEISSVSKQKYIQSRYDALIGLPRLARVLGPGENYDFGGDFQQKLLTSTRLRIGLKSYKPSRVAMLEDYTMQDIFPVRVTFKSGWRVEAETVDPRYTRIAGKLLLEIPPKRGKMTSVRDVITVGCTLWATLTDRDTYTFEICDAVEDFYRHMACESAGKVFPAVYAATYAHGTEWVTNTGLRVGIDNSKIEGLDEESIDAIEAAKLDRTPILIRTYQDAPDKDKENFHVYAEPEDISDDAPFSIDEADKALYRAYMKSAETEVQDLRPVLNVQFKETEPENIGSLATLLQLMANAPGMPTPMRLEYLITSGLLFNICDQDSNLSYVDREIDYLSKKVQFAAGDDMTPLTTPVGENDPLRLQRHAQVVEVLSGYKKKAAVGNRTLDTQPTWEEKLERVKTLIRASNDLSEIIDERELNNIKHSIAKILEVDDMYESILADRTYYGDENTTQEFKSSAVCPPANRRRSLSEVFDPDLQKWHIFKAVCAFLNSRAGGEVLVGVNDSGYASGVDEDIQQLYRHRMIGVANADHYALYLNRILNNAFEEMNGERKSADIANNYIDVFPETNDEGQLIVRIKVQPYQKQIIVLSDAPGERPAHISAWYYRKNGRSVAGTPGAIQEIMKFK